MIVRYHYSRASVLEGIGPKQHFDPLERHIRKEVTRFDHPFNTTVNVTHFVWQGLRLLTGTRHTPERPAKTRVYRYEQDSYAPLPVSTPYSTQGNFRKHLDKKYPKWKADNGTELLQDI